MPFSEMQAFSEKIRKTLVFLRDMILFLMHNLLAMQCLVGKSISKKGIKNSRL